RLFQDLGHHAGAHRAAALADREPQLLLHRDRRDQLDRHLRVVPRHHHLHPGGQLHRPRHIRRPKVKLRPIPLEKRRVPAPLVLRQHVHFTLKLRVRRDALRLRQHHPPLHLLLLDAPQEPPPAGPPRPPSPPTPVAPQCRPRDTRTSTTAPAPPAPPGPTAPRRLPGRTCSKRPRSPARSPAAPAKCAPASAASARPPHSPRESPRP